jgi:integrase/recombinase XerD
MLYVRIEYQRKRKCAVLDTQIIENLLNSMDQETILHQRNRAIVALLCATDMKITELSKLTMDNFNKSCSVLQVNKGKKYRLNDGAAAILRKYINKLSLFRELTGKSLLFLSQKGHPLTRQACWNLVKGALKEAELTDDLSPIKLRGALVDESCSDS